MKMKKYRQMLLPLLSSLLLLTQFSVQAQTFGATGAQWHYNGQNAAPPEYAGYIRFTSTSDTMVLGRQTHKIESMGFSFQGDSSASASYFVYEQADTVFLFSPDRNRFLVLYLFNGQQGDTLTLDAPFILPWADSTYRLVIDSVWQTAVDGLTHNVYQTTPLDAFFIDGGRFMDRIGGLNWFLPITIGIPEGPGPIRCFADAEIDTNFYAYPCDYRLSTGLAPVLSAGDPGVLYPNPASDVVTVRFFSAIPPNSVARVYDASGRTILQQPVTPTANGTFELRIDQLARGVYWLQVVEGKHAHRPMALRIHP